MGTMELRARLSSATEPQERYALAAALGAVATRLDAAKATEAAMDLRERLAAATGPDERSVLAGALGAIGVRLTPVAAMATAVRMAC